MTENYRPATFTTIILSFVLISVSFAILLFNPAGVVKGIGYVILFIPRQLGLIQPVHTTDIQTINLSVASQKITFSEPGRYFAYYRFPFLSIPGGASYQQPPGIKIVSQETNERIFITSVKRGVRPYDTPFASGKPYYTFTIDHPGTYQVTHSTMDGKMSIAPDYTTGKESPIRSIFVAELAIIGLMIGIFIYRKYQKQQRSLVPLKQNSAARAKAFDQLIASEKKKTR